MLRSRKKDVQRSGVDLQSRTSGDFGNSLLSLDDLLAIDEEDEDILDDLDDDDLDDDDLDDDDLDDDDLDDDDLDDDDLDDDDDFDAFFSDYDDD